MTYAMRVVASLLLIVITVAGCRDVPTSPGVQGDLAMQRLLWVSRAIDDYDYDLTFRNEWVPATTARVEVRGGEVVKLTLLSTGEVQTTPGHACWRTVDEIFDLATVMRADTARVVQLGYHAKLAYPVLLWVDAPAWADDAFGFTARNLTRR